MNLGMQSSIQEAIDKLKQHGFQDCTEAANHESNMEYLCVFERPSDEKPVYYCCTTGDDLFALLSLVEASLRHKGQRHKNDANSEGCRARCSLAERSSTECLCQ